MSSEVIDLTCETLTLYASSSYTLTVKTEHNLSSPPSTKKNAYIDLSSDTPQEVTPDNRRLHAAAATAHVIDTKCPSFICSVCAPIFGRFGIACAEREYRDIWLQAVITRIEQNGGYEKADEIDICLDKRDIMQVTGLFEMNNCNPLPKCMLDGSYSQAFKVAKNPALFEYIWSKRKVNVLGW